MTTRTPTDTARTSRQAYELAIKLAAELTPGERGLMDMPARQRQEKLEAATLWAQIAIAHSNMALRDKLTEIIRLMAKDMRTRGVLSDFEEKVTVSKQDMRDAGMDPDDERTWGRDDADDEPVPDPQAEPDEDYAAEADSEGGEE